jgi:hypothetical protein
MNWFIGFMMGIFLTAGYHRIQEGHEEKQAKQFIEFEEMIAAYNKGASDVLRLNPIDPRLESTCVQLWGMKQ